MAISTRNGDCYGDDLEDLKQVIVRYSVANGYEATRFREAVCNCGGDRFHVELNDEQGVAARTCKGCGQEHGIGDRAAYAEEVDLIWEAECVCGCADFRITVGVSLYADRDDVRWFYLGLFCTACSRIGVYGDWKSEYQGYQALLDSV